MYKIWTIIALFIAYFVYSAWVYKGGTDYGSIMTERQVYGKQIYQKFNCQACHQIFGLGGYLGPELTMVVSDKHRGVAYAKAFLENGGGTRMPNFNFSKAEIEAVLDYLKYVDQNASAPNN
jgi:nitric oxide reductase subunit C